MTRAGHCRVWREEGASLAVRRPVVAGHRGEGWRGEGGRPCRHGRRARGGEEWSRARAGRQRAGERGRMAVWRHGREGDEDVRAPRRSRAEPSSLSGLAVVARREEVRGRGVVEGRGRRMVAAQAAAGEEA